MLLLGWCSSFLNQGHQCGLGNQERKKSMSKNKTEKRGLALGVVAGLIAALFVGAPAQANSTTAFTFDPAGPGTSFGTFVDEDFTMLVQRVTSQIPVANDFETLLKYDISTNRSISAFNSSTFSVQVLAGTANASIAASGLAMSTSYNLTVNEYSAQRLYYGSPAISQFADSANDKSLIPGVATGGVLPTQSYVLTPATRSATADNHISIRLVGEDGSKLSTLSPTVIVTVRPFLDLNGNNVFDSATEPSAVQTVTFHNYAAVAPTVTVTKGTGANDHTVTASAALSSSINYGQLSGKFFIKWTYAGQSGAQSGVEMSANGERTVTDANFATALSASYRATNSSFLAASWSAQVGYDRDGAVDDGDDGQLVTAERDAFDFAFRVWGLNTAAAETGGVSSSAIATDPNDNQLANGNVRPNSTYTVTVGVRSGTGSASGQVVTFRFGGTSLSTTKTIAVNGGVASTGSHNAVTVTTGVNGLATATIVAAGFDVGEHIAVTASAVGVTAVGVRLQMTAPTWTITPETNYMSTTPGTPVTIRATVEDQWEVKSTRTDQQVWFTKSAPFNNVDTISKVAVVGGVATATITPTPATQTGSMDVTPTLRTLNQNTGLYDLTTATVTGTDVEVFVTSATNGFLTGLAKSYSATISYGVDYSWSPLISAARVIVSGSSVVVSGTGLIFKDNTVLENIGENRLTLPGTANGVVEFYVTARKAGTYTLTLTAGTATTTSLIVVSDAWPENGKNMTFDVSSMESGRAAIVTGTLIDLNGNPVDTPADRIALTVTGTGATYVGSLTTQTDANGRFQVALLSGTNQTGTITITAVYSPTATAAAADKVTKVHTVSVVTPAAPEVNAVIGSFSGRWAVRVENAKGSVVSVKAGNRWVKFSALNNNYLFSRKSVVGRTIAVSVWVDGELQNSQTITIK